MNLTIIILVFWFMGFVSNTEFIKRLPDWAVLTLTLGLYVLAVNIDGSGL